MYVRIYFFNYITDIHSYIHPYIYKEVKTHVYVHILLTFIQTNIHSYIHTLKQVSHLTATAIAGFDQKFSLNFIFDVL